jgi:hypothetical protein
MERVCGWSKESWHSIGIIVQHENEEFGEETPLRQPLLSVWRRTKSGAFLRPILWSFITVKDKAF